MLFVMQKALMRLLAVLLSAQRAVYCAKFKKNSTHNRGFIKKQDRTYYQMSLGC